MTVATFGQTWSGRPAWGRARSGAARRLRANAAWLAPAAALLAWWVVLAFTLPYGADESVYRSVARGIFDGRWPYRDLFDNKQPLLYMWYFPAALGASVELQRVFAGALTAASCAPMYVIARRYLTGRQPAFAVAAYAGLLANPFMGPGTNADSYTLLPIVAAVAAPSPLLAGVLIGAASATKLTAALFLPVLFYRWRAQSSRVGTGALVVPLAAAIAFAPVWRDFWDANFAFNLSFGSAAAEGGLAGRITLDSWVILGALPFWGAAVAGALISRHRLVLVWSACALISIKATGLEYAHYYLLLTPPAALFAGVALDRIATAVRASGPVARGPLLRSTLTTVAAMSAVPMMTLAAVAVTYGVHSRHAHDEVVAAIDARPGELYVLGDRPQIYAKAGREPERRFFFAVPLSVRTDWEARTRASLLSCPPDVLVVPRVDEIAPSWAQDVEVMYADRAEFYYATVYTSPRATCSVTS